MFSYYGSKSKIIDLYPAPKYGRIIEPFAGSARYALKYWDRDVLLVDKYEVIVRIWKWLQQCSPQDILKLPRLKEGERIRDFNFDCDEQKWLLGFLIAKGVESPRDKATARATTIRPNNINFQLRRIAVDIAKIKHWEIIQGDYSIISNQKATWFIDPPYQFGGQAYAESGKNIDYVHLASWCQSRQGQVVVCENTKSNWLTFSALYTQKGSLGFTTEAIWCNDVTQLKLFADAEKV